MQNPALQCILTGNGSQCRPQWILKHFNNGNGVLPRNDPCIRLSNYLGRKNFQMFALIRRYLWQHNGVDFAFSSTTSLHPTCSPATHRRGRWITVSRRRRADPRWTLPQCLSTASAPAWAQLVTALWVLSLSFGCWRCAAWLMMPATEILWWSGWKYRSGVWLFRLCLGLGIAAGVSRTMASERIWKWGGGHVECGVPEIFFSCPSTFLTLRVRFGERFCVMGYTFWPASCLPHGALSLAICKSWGHVPRAAFPEPLVGNRFISMFAFVYLFVITPFTVTVLYLHSLRIKSVVTNSQYASNNAIKNFKFKFVWASVFRGTLRNVDRHYNRYIGQSSSLRPISRHYSYFVQTLAISSPFYIKETGLRVVAKKRWLFWHTCIEYFSPVNDVVVGMPVTRLVAVKEERAFFPCMSSLHRQVMAWPSWRGNAGVFREEVKMPWLWLKFHLARLDSTRLDTFDVSSPCILAVSS